MAARGVWWIDQGVRKPTRDLKAIWSLRPGDAMLVTSKSIIADIIDAATRGDVPGLSPRITHAEMVKMLAQDMGPVVASAEPNGLVNKMASRHFAKGRSGEVWRHFEFARLDVSAKLRDIMDADQGGTDYYGLIQAVFASDLVNKLLGWIPAVKSLQIYRARAKFCTWALADWVRKLQDFFPGTQINPLRSSDGPANQLSPRELWFALDRSERERTGWRKIMEWDL